MLRSSEIDTGWPACARMFQAASSDLGGPGFARTRGPARFYDGDGQLRRVSLSELQGQDVPRPAGERRAGLKRQLAAGGLSTKATSGRPIHL